MSPPNRNQSCERAKPSVGTWIAGGCIALQVLMPACQRSKRAVASLHAQQSVHDAGSRATSGSAIDAAIAEAGNPALPRCGLAKPRRVDLIPMVHNRLVVSRNLRGTKLTGSAKLVARPDDYERYYLAESGFDPSSLPTQVQGLSGASVNFVSAPDCHAKVGKFATWAWADEAGAGWKSGDASFNAARAFRDGDSFIVAQLEMDCAEKNVAGATGNLPSHFHAWQVRDLSEQAQSEENIRLMQKGLAALELDPALAVSNAEYARFRGMSRQPLPDHWWFLPKSYARWSLATDGDAALLIVELQTREPIAQPEFSMEWLGVWCLGTGGRLEPLGLDYLPRELAGTVAHHRHRLQVAGAPSELPLILYSYYALQADSGRYQTYEYALPAPVRLQ